MWKALVSIWNSFWSLFRAGTENVAKSVKNHELEAKHDIADRAEDADKFREQIVQLRKQVNLDIGEAEELEEEMKKWDNLADKAAQDGNEEHVAKFVKELDRVTDRYEVLQQAVKDNTEVIDGLRNQPEDFEDDIEDDKTKLARFQANNAAEDLRARASDLRSKMSNRKSAMGALEEHVEEKRAENDARADLSKSDADSLADQYEKTNDVSSAVAERLAKYNA
jgi:phage shock protein A